MFQDFSAPQIDFDPRERLQYVRDVMKGQGISAYFQPRSDIHQGEYVPPCDERLAWISGFTGSAGACCIGLERAALFVDGRYTLQASAQTDPESFSIEDFGIEKIAAWLAESFGAGSRIGFDADLLTVSYVRGLKKRLDPLGIELVALNENPIDAIWQDRERRPSSPIIDHPVSIAGVDAEDKLQDVINQLENHGADTLLLTLPDSICWLLNIRGRDIPHTPVKLAFAKITKGQQATLFVDHTGTPDDVIKRLEALVVLKGYDTFFDELSRSVNKGEKVWLDPATAPHRLAQCVSHAGARIIEKRDPCQALKAKKNASEIKGMKAAHCRDALACCRFLKLFQEEMERDGLDEISAARRLEECRREAGEASGVPLLDLSFDTISGSGPNGAIVHYRVNEKTNRTIGKNDLYLVDSGAQYSDGTTDITRTLIAGEPTAEMKDRYTRVLKGHIALSLARFPKGTTGGQLDSLARQFLWEAGLDYAHGTGHGVGACLSVHEGPQRIAKRQSDTVLEPGMILSNEPGYYKTGEYGIRIENLLLVRDLNPDETESSGWLGFETLTFVPYCEKLLDRCLLIEREKRYLEYYNEQIVNVLRSINGESDLIEWIQREVKGSL